LYLYTHAMAMGTHHGLWLAAMVETLYSSTYISCLEYHTSIYTLTLFNYCINIFVEYIIDILVGINIIIREIWWKRVVTNNNII